MMTKPTLVRRLVAGTLALAAGGALAVAVAMPANAGSFNGSCESGEVCLYWQYDYVGPMADFYNNVSNYSNWHFYNSSYWLNDNSRSAKNNASWSCVFIYQHANYSGHWVAMSAGANEASFEDLNDQLSSHYWMPPTADCSNW